jgi:hypothetical protein
MSYPRLSLVKQTFETAFIPDIPAKIHEELIKLNLPSKVKAGQTVAVTAGSRGIDRINIILKAVVDELKTLKARPFIVPAMGGHGGGTAEGQVSVLTKYGITEKEVSVPIKSSMDVVELGRSKLDIPVYFDKHAYQADHVVVINRIKPHTRFIGQIESGLLKMLVVGLGKREGAAICHRAIAQHNFDEIVHSVAPIILTKIPVLFGLAILENAYRQTADLIACKPEEFLYVEPVLKEKAAGMTARLPFNNVDLLIIDEMGKDISGTGMDTNIIGRSGRSDIEVTRIYVRDLTEKSKGNACGIGLADFTTRGLVNKIDFQETYFNCITGMRPEGAKIPITCENDKEAIDKALLTLNVSRPEDAKIIRIKNTSQLDKLTVSESYDTEVKRHPNLEPLSPAKEIEFDSNGNLLPSF